MTIIIYCLRDLSLLISTSVVLVVLKKYVVHMVGRHLDAKKNKRIKAQNCLFNIMYYGFTSIYGYCIFRHEMRLKDVYTYYEQDMNNVYVLKTSFYYAIEFSYYLTELYHTFVSYDYKDRTELILHHFITLTLIVLSYAKGYTNVGMVVMALHDFSDPILESAKLFIYMARHRLADAVFILFVVFFVITRLFVFPILVIYPEIICMIYHDKNIANVICIMLLCCLYLLHLYWSVMIYKTFYKIFVQNKYQDARSDSNETH